MLVHRLRRWPNIEPTMGEWLLGKRGQHSTTTPRQRSLTWPHPGILKSQMAVTAYLKIKQLHRFAMPRQYSGIRAKTIKKLL